MANILVVLGSARTGRIADTILTHVKTDLEKRENVSITVADLKELALPFLDSEVVPMSPDFEVTDSGVKAWAELVASANGVVLLMPEYNHSMSAIQKNAIDWLYSQWSGKPVAIIGYGWSGGALALVTAKEVLGNVKAKLLPTSAHLAFMKQLNVDGTILDEASTNAAIKVTLDELIEAISV